MERSTPLKPAQGRASFMGISGGETSGNARPSSYMTWVSGWGGFGHLVGVWVEVVRVSSGVGVRQRSSSEGRGYCVRV